MYSEEFITYLKRNDCKSFTHRDILKHTDTNCSYSVVKYLKKELEKLGLKLVETIEYRTNKKNARRRFKRYWIEKLEGQL